MWFIELCKWLISLFPSRGGDRRKDFRVVTDHYERLVERLQTECGRLGERLDDCEKKHDAQTTLTGELQKQIIQDDVKHAGEIAALSGKVDELTREIITLRNWKHSIDPIQRAHIAGIQQAIKVIEDQQASVALEKIDETQG